MSDTRRSIPRDCRKSPRGPYDRHSPRWEQTHKARNSSGYLVTAPDGARTFRLEISRDCRVTGLREHKLHRSQARQQLAADPDNIIAGKTRRYAVRREAYLI